MEILKFGDAPTPNRKNNNQRKPAAMVVAGLLVAMMGMSTTLAGTISISGGRVEFGQGLVNTAACDSNGITLTPTSSFTNSGSDSDTFTVSTLKLSGISDDCQGKYFTLKAFAGTSATSLGWTTGAATGNAIKFLIPTDANNADTSTTWAAITATGILGGYGFASASGWAANGGAGEITLTGLAISNTVTRFTIESTDA